MRQLRALIPLVALVSIASSLGAQSDATCAPAAEQAGRTVGCSVIARYDLGRLLIRPPLYWHLDVYSTRVAAERAAQRDNRSTLVEAYGKLWLFTIAPFEWRTPDGERWGTVGPLPVLEDVPDYRAVYVQGALEPFLTATPHRHDGAEAWFTLEGSICAETPDGKQEQSVGEPGGVVVPGGVPMLVAGTGTGPHRALGVILQSASKPMAAPVDWRPKGLCR